jgi:hypothetical protein
METLLPYSPSDNVLTAISCHFYVGHETEQTSPKSDHENYKCEVYFQFHFTTFGRFYLFFELLKFLCDSPEEKQR